MVSEPTFFSSNKSLRHMARTMAATLQDVPHTHSPTPAVNHKRRMRKIGAKHGVEAMFAYTAQHEARA